MTTRSERAQRRAAKQRNQRIIAIVIILLALAGTSFIAYRIYLNNYTPPAPTTSQTEQQSAIKTTPDDIPGTLTTTSSGLKYDDLVIGTGAEAKSGDTVSVHYVGWLQDGTQFDSSRDRGTPYEVTIGVSSVIKGWHEGLVGMKVGGKRLLIIPPDLAYGSTGAGGGVIPPDAMLTFEIELLEIK